MANTVRWHDSFQCPRCRSGSVIKYGVIPKMESSIGIHTVENLLERKYAEP